MIMVDAIRLFSNNWSQKKNVNTLIACNVVQYDTLMRSGVGVVLISISIIIRKLKNTCMIIVSTKTHIIENIKFKEDTRKTLINHRVIYVDSINQCQVIYTMNLLWRWKFVRVCWDCSQHKIYNPLFVFNKK